jgi:hypothetical protein
MIVRLYCISGMGSAGKLQMAADFVILAAGLVIRDPLSVVLSIIGALALNLVLAVNHKAGSYPGM